MWDLSLFFLFFIQTGRRNVDMDLAFSHKKRGKKLFALNQSNVTSKNNTGLSFFICYSCLSVFLIPMWIVYLLLLGHLSPKHKRNSKQVNDGMFLPLVSSYLHDCVAFISHNEDLFLSSETSYCTFCLICQTVKRNQEHADNNSLFCLKFLLLCKMMAHFP